MNINEHLRPIRLFLKKILPNSIFKLVDTFALLVFLPSSIIKPLKYKLFAFPLITTFFKDFFYPDRLYIFLTTRCNIRCFICRREDFTGEDLKFENIYKLEKQIKHASYINLTGWGECFLYPQFKQVLNYIFSINKKNRIIQITTNGTLLSKEFACLLKGKLNYLEISLNAATAETYNRDMKYGDFGKTINNIQDFMSGLDDDDRKCVMLHFVAHVDNYKEIAEFVHLAKRLNIGHVSIGIYLVSTVDHLDKGLFNVKDEYNKIVFEANAIAQTHKIDFSARQFFTESPASPQDCTSPFWEIFINTDGNISSPCCYSGVYSMGNVYESSFDDVWFGSKYTMLRKKRHLPACQHCTPFIPIDDVRAHFHSFVKQRSDFDSIINKIGGV